MLSELSQRKANTRDLVYMWNLKKKIELTDTELKRWWPGAGLGAGGVMEVRGYQPSVIR